MKSDSSLEMSEFSNKIRGFFLFFHKKYDLKGFTVRAKFSQFFYVEFVICSPGVYIIYYLYSLL